MSEEEFSLDPELQAFVEDRLGSPFNEDSGQPPGDDESEDNEGDEVADGEDGGEQEDDGETVAPPPAPTGDIIEVAPGVALTREQALSYHQFDAILKGRPELAEEIEKLIQGPSRGGGEHEPAPPPSLDLPEEYQDDPAFKQIHDAYSRQHEYLQSLESRVKELTDVTQTREQEEFKTLLSNSQTSFAKSHGLSDEEMKQVTGIAERLNVVPSLLRGVNPVTGEPEARDRATALNRAFEIAYWYLPETRERAINSKLQDRAKDTRRKQRLAGVSGGGGGSMSRQASDPRKMNEQQRREAMTREIAEGMGLSSED